MEKVRRREGANKGRRRREKERRGRSKLLLS
jgi:hypothetical protein